MTELESRLALLELPLGGDPDIREKERAAAWLLDHADDTYPELLTRAQDGRAGPATVELLGRFGRPDSVPVLAGLLAIDDIQGVAAARALTTHPAPEAHDALLEALRAGGSPAVLAADALGARGDDRACADLAQAATDADARLRYHAVQAAGSLGCLTPERLQELEAADPDPDVRDLARRLLT